MKIINIDFESRSQADIWSVGAYNYSIHPTTEILCLCYSIDQGPIKTIDFHREEPFVIGAKIQQLNKIIPECEFHAYNAFFERCMWRAILTPVWGAAPVPIRQWQCTMAKGMAHALPAALAKCAMALKTKNQKSMAGGRKMKQIASSTGAITNPDMDELIEYCIQDVATEREIDQRLPDLIPSEQMVWQLDQYINDTGVAVDMDAVNAAVEIITKEKEILTKELVELTDGDISKGTQTIAIRRWLQAKGLDLPNLQKNTVTDALENADPKYARILELRQVLSLTSNAKYLALQQYTSADGRCRDNLFYHGASTGRWTGKAVQIHNLPKPKFDEFDNLPVIKILKGGGHAAMSMLYQDDTLAMLSSCIRGMFVPEQGYDMFITDFAAIEARVLMWGAGELKGVQLFQDQDRDPDSDTDIYVEQGKQIFGKKNLTKADYYPRQVGKQAILGCGFGMGAPKFKITCGNYRIDVSDELALRAVQGYRSTFTRVPQFWYAMEGAAKRAVLNPGRGYQCEKVLWYLDGEFLRAKLPSGRTLAYHHPKVTNNELSFMALNNKTKQYTVERTWGGTLVENCVQGIARDIMAWAMLEFATSGFRILFTVHDELVLSAPKGTKNKDDVLRIVRRVPEWAYGCPINAECDLAERYKKA